MAGIDAIVCVYALSSLVGNLSDNVKHWQHVKLCRGHTFDSESPIIVWKLTDLRSKERRTHAIMEDMKCTQFLLLPSQAFGLSW